MGVEMLLGKILKEVAVADDEILFYTLCGKVYSMVHSQDCCESVVVESIVGDVNELLGTPVIVAEEATSINSTPPGTFGPFKKDARDDPPDESYTWTFYKIDTWKGGVTIRWFGSSNGYYSESVSFTEVKCPPK